MLKQGNIYKSYKYDIGYDLGNRKNNFEINAFLLIECGKSKTSRSNFWGPEIVVSKSF